MSRYVTALVVSLGFITGLLASPAIAASHPGVYAKIFGHSTSCALGRASVNDSTYRGGALTANFVGCSSSNARRSTPPSYLGARAYVVRNANGAICGTSSLKWNTSTASSRDASTPRTSYNNSCDMTGYYFGLADNYRRSSAGAIYVRQDRVSNAYYFNSSLT